MRSPGTGVGSAEAIGAESSLDIASAPFSAHSEHKPLGQLGGRAVPHSGHLLASGIGMWSLALLRLSLHAGEQIRKDCRENHESLAEDGQQVPNFFVNLLRSPHRVRDFLTHNFPVPFAEPMYGG